MDAWKQQRSKKSPAESRHQLQKRTIFVLTTSCWSGRGPCHVRPAVRCNATCAVLHICRRPCKLCRQVVSGSHFVNPGPDSIPTRSHAALRAIPGHVDMCACAQYSEPYLRLGRVHAPHEAPGILQRLEKSPDPDRRQMSLINRLESAGLDSPAEATQRPRAPVQSASDSSTRSLCHLSWQHHTHCPHSMAADENTSLR